MAPTCNCRPVRTPHPTAEAVPSLPSPANVPAPPRERAAAQACERHGGLGGLKGGGRKSRAGFALCVGVDEEVAAYNNPAHGTGRLWYGSAETALAEVGSCGRDPLRLNLMEAPMFRILEIASKCVLAGLFAVAMLAHFNAAQARSFKVLHSFAGGSDGCYPVGGLILDGAGNLYGTTAGGTCSYGTVFKLAPGGTKHCFIVSQVEAVAKDLEPVWFSIRKEICTEPLWRVAVSAVASYSG